MRTTGTYWLCRCDVVEGRRSGNRRRSRWSQPFFTAPLLLRRAFYIFWTSLLTGLSCIELPRDDRRRTTKRTISHNTAATWTVVKVSNWSRNRKYRILAEPHLANPALDITLVLVGGSLLHLPFVCVLRYFPSPRPRVKLLFLCRLRVLVGNDADVDVLRWPTSSRPLSSGWLNQWRVAEVIN